MSSDSTPDSDPLSDAAGAPDAFLTRRRLVVAGLAVCLVVGVVGFAQAMSGYLATHQLSFAEVSVTEYSDPSDGSATVAVAVENPTRESFAVLSYRLTGIVDGEPVLAEGRRVLDEPVVVPPGERRTLTLSISTVSDRAALIEAGQVTFDGRLAVRIDAHRQFLSIETSTGGGR